MITKKEIADRICRKGKIDTKIEKGVFYDAWAIRQVRPNMTLIYRKRAFYEYDPEHEPGRKCIFNVYIDCINKTNPPTQDQIRFEYRIDQPDQEGKFVDEAPEEILKWLDQLLYVKK